MGDVICISEIIDIYPGNLDSSLCFIQPGISHDVFCRSVLAAMDRAAEAWPREATPCLRSGVVAKRSYPVSKVRGGGREELPNA